MQEVSINMLKEGVSWDDVHLAAHKVAIEGLLKIGILQGDKEDILKTRTSVAFFPHGVGHYLGMDTHDTGGNPNPNDKDTMFRYLRLRANLPAGSIVTVEPGVSPLLPTWKRRKLMVPRCTSADSSLSHTSKTPFTPLISTLRC
jgi:Xaa-Pro dipeptidase